MTTAVSIPIQKLPAEITIRGEWIAKRDEALVDSKAIVAVSGQSDMDKAGESLQAITRLSASLEKMRLEYGRPFREVDALIKKKADDARKPLEDEKARLKAICGAWAEAEFKRKIEEAKRADEYNRKMAEEAIIKQGAADRLAAELGIDEKPLVIITPEIVVDPVKMPETDSARLAMVIKWELEDEDKVPRNFLTFDERKLNAYLRENKDRIKKMIADKEDVIPGIKFREVPDIRSR